MSITEEVIEDSQVVLLAIEEALAANDPYNNLAYSSDYTPTLEDCDLPDHIEDPLLLLRLVLGNERAETLEWMDDLELIAQALDECIAQSRKKGAAQSTESRHSQKVQG
jgi:hypothetical protein